MPFDSTAPRLLPVFSNPEVIQMGIARISNGKSTSVY